MKTLQRVEGEVAATLNTYQDCGELVKQSSRNESKLIFVEITNVVNTHQDIKSQDLKIGELVKQCS